MNTEEAKILGEAVAAVAKDTYEDGAKPLVKSVGGIISAPFSFLYNVVLYPLRKVNATYAAKIKQFEKNLEVKYDAIPQENRQEPQMNIVGPTLEALRFTINEDEVRAMFEELITKSMDSRFADRCHPSYVEVIKQMNKYDALLLKSIKGYEQVLAFDFSREESLFLLDDLVVENAEFDINGYEGVVIKRKNLPTYFIGEIFGLEAFEISKSLAVLERLGLITKDHDLEIDDKTFEEFGKLNDALQKYLSIKIKRNPNRSYSRYYTRRSFIFTEFGLDFILTCVG